MVRLFLFCLSYFTCLTFLYAGEITIGMQLSFQTDLISEPRSFNIDYFNNLSQITARYDHTRHYITLCGLSTKIFARGDFSYWVSHSVNSKKYFHQFLVKVPENILNNIFVEAQLKKVIYSPPTRGGLKPDNITLYP